MAPNPVKVPGSGNGGNHVGRELDAATMGMTDDQIKHLPTLERTMVKTFGVFVTVSMVLIAIMYVTRNCICLSVVRRLRDSYCGYLSLCCRLIVSIVLTGNATENISEDGLEDQINDHLKSSAIELSEKVNLRFKAIEESVVNFTVSIHGQAAEDDSSDILEYQEYKDFASDEDGENSICHELDGSVQVERLRGTDIETAATLNYSVWAIPEGEDDNDPQVEQDREDSFTMQYFYRNLWRNNIPLIALYTGKKTVSSPLHVLQVMCISNELTAVGSFGLQVTRSQIYGDIIQVCIVYRMKSTKKAELFIIWCHHRGLRS